VIIVIVIAVILGAAFAVVDLRKTDRDRALDQQTSADLTATVGVDVAKVSYAPPTDVLTLPGDARAWYESTIYGRVNGYVADWSADIGDHVKKGQVLATIDTPDLDAQLQAAEHELAIAQAQVKVAQASSSFAETTYQRWRQSPKGVVSEQERDQKKSEYDSAMASVTAAEAKVSADESDVNRLSAMQDFKRVTAPFDGVITARHIDIGDLVTAGSTSNTTPLYAIAQESRMRMYVDVPQSQAAAMLPGVSAEITSRALPNRVFVGTIARTSDSIDPATGALHVEVDASNPDQALMPGMYLQVSFQVPHAPMVRVPASAVMFHSDGPYVATVNPAGTVSFHKVVIGVDNGDTVDLIQGISATDHVALNLSSEVTAGEKVQALMADSATASAAAPALPNRPASGDPPEAPKVASTDK
jgi:RND family efflux transporter MFP subunit